MHLMIDLETTGTDPMSAIASVGLVAFDKKGIISECYCVLDVEEQLRLGRAMDLSTMLWWAGQSKEAQSVFTDLSNRISVKEFKDALALFIKDSLHKKDETSDGLKVWGNGANFDVSMIEHLLKHTGEFMPIPWRFWNVRCFRTFADLTKCKDLVKREGTHHNALDDARYQAECVIAVYNRNKAGKK